MSGVVESEEPRGLELRPQPRTKRLSRRVLFVVAGLGLATLLAATLTLSRVQQQRDGLPVPGAENSPLGGDGWWSGQSDGVQGIHPRPLRSPDVAAGPPVELDEPGPEPPSPLPMAPPRVPPEPDLLAERRTERLRRAREAPPLVPGFRSREASAELNVGNAGAPGIGLARPPLQHPDLLGQLDGLREAIHGPDPSIAQNGQAAKKAFLDGSATPEEHETNPHPVRQPLSPYEVTAGSILPAVLITQANSDLPGMMTARIRENVYDSATGKHLLVPQGATLIGAYDSVISFGQERLLVAWQRILFPDGTKLNIGSMPGADLTGTAGFSDRVDRHYASLFGSAFLLSAIGAAAQLSQEGDNAAGFGGAKSSRDEIQDTLSAALGQNLSETANQMLRRHMNRQPTIEIRPGTRFNVLVRRDLIFAEPYFDTYAGGTP